MPYTRKNLGDILIEEGVLSAEELDEVLEKSKARNRSLEETLFTLGYLSRDALGRLVAKLHGCEFIDLYAHRVDEDALSTIPAETARELQALPYGFDGDTLLVALAGTFETRPFEETVAELERAAGRKIRPMLCNPGPLAESLARLCTPVSGRPPQDGGTQEQLSFAGHAAAPNLLSASRRAQFEEMFEVGRNAVIAVRSHPFSSSVQQLIEEATAKLGESRKYLESGFAEDAVGMAKRAVALLRDARARADALAEDWEGLAHRAKKLLAKIDSLEASETADTQGSEYTDLIHMRSTLNACIDARDIERLRPLLDRGAEIAEQITLQEPGARRSKEQVLLTLAKVREIVARAHDAGAEEHATEILREAHELLDEADDFARYAQWENVTACLTSAESKALEAERIAIQAEEEKERLTVKLRESIRAATSVYEKAMAHPFAQEVAEHLMRAKDSISESKKCFENGPMERGIELAHDVAGYLRDEIIPHEDRAEQDWNELSRRIDKVSTRIQSIDISVALRIMPDKLRFLFHSEREMIIALYDRNRKRLADAVGICEGLAEKIDTTSAAAKPGLEHAEAAIAEATSALTSAAAYVIDKHTSSLHDEARHMVERARAALERGDADAAGRLARAARIKLEAEIIEPQQTTRQEWNDLLQQAKDIAEQLQSIDKLEALKIADEKAHLLFNHGHEIISLLAERNRTGLAGSLAACEELIKETRRIIAEEQDNLREAGTAVDEVKRLLAVAASSGIDDYVGSVYEDLVHLVHKAGECLESGDAEAALEFAQTARAKLESDVIQRQTETRDKWNTLIPQVTDLIQKVHTIGETDAPYYCADLVGRLYKDTTAVYGALAERDLQKATTTAATLAGNLASVEGEIQLARSEHLRQLFEELEEIDSAVQKAVQTCAGNYSADMLENVYLDLNQIKEQLAKGPETLTAETERALRSNLAVARAKVWQVEFMRERFEREREETLRQLQLKLDAAREAVTACAKLDFVGKSVPLLEKARSFLDQVDSFLIEGDIEESFEVIRQADALTEELFAIAENNERRWKKLGDSLAAEDAPHRVALGDPIAEKLAPEEHRALAELTAQTQSILDAKDLVALEHHSENLAQKTAALDARMKAEREQECARIQRKIQEARREIRVAELLGGLDVSPDTIKAAHTYAGIADTYVKNDDFARADTAADDALAKSRDASALAKSVAEHANRVTLDYMKIAAAHIRQQNLEAAQEAIDRALDLAEHPPASPDEPGESEAPLESADS